MYVKNSGLSGQAAIKDFFAKKNVFSLRNLIFMGLMLAIGAVLSRFTLYITPTFKAITFAYLPGAMVAMLLGPWAAIIYGFVSDFILYIVNPQGGYFPGYALSEMFTYFIYACFMYQKPVTILRVTLARAIITVAVTFGLNYIWTSMMYGTAASGYFTGARLINNIVQFPFHVVLITFVGKKLLKLKPNFMRE